MRSVDRSSRILLAGALVSVLVHAALAAGFVRWSKEAVLRLVSKPPPAPEQRREPQRPPPNRPKKPEIRLGIEKSDADTMTWLGFEKPTEHQAEQGTVEQSAMTMADPGPARAPAPQPGEQRPAEEAAATPPAPTPVPPPPDAPPHPELATTEPSPDPAAMAEQLKQLSEQLSKARQELADQFRQLADAIPAVRPPPQGPPPVAPPPAPQPAAPPPQPSPAKQSSAKPTTEGGGIPGIKSDKESIAVAIRHAPTVRPGQVVAAQGLDIQTRQPRWTQVTLMTRAPRNPTVRITFSRDGRVRQADFVSDGRTIYNTGFDDVDQPLLDAIYGWTAKGKPLNDLDPADPKAGLTVLITIILRSGA